MWLILYPPAGEILASKSRPVSQMLIRRGYPILIGRPIWRTGSCHEVMRADGTQWI
jgi:hypothetical protein